MIEETSFYLFSDEKNRKLVIERKISFEEIIAAIKNGNLLDILVHPNQEKYLNQKIYVVNLNNYIYLVPFIENKDNTVFLKTIIPSRKANKKYLKESKQ